MTLRPVHGLTLLLAALLAGCAPWSTYPSVEISGANPEFRPFPDLMAAAIEYAHEQWGDGGEVIYQLPEGTSDKVYASVQTRLGEGRRRVSAGERTVYVQQVRSRALEGEVDVLYPGLDDVYELATLRFQSSIAKGWHVTSARQWRIPRDEPALTYEGTPEAVAEAEPPTG